MTAKLAWRSGDLWLGRMWVAGIEWRAADGYRYKIPHRPDSEPYQSAADARQDAESEVRRLLKEAGVVLAD